MKLVVFGTTLKSNKEVEITSKDRLGMTATVVDKFGNVDTFNNITEFHHKYPSPLAKQMGHSSAFESDIHGTGCTRQISKLSSITIDQAKKIEESY